MTLREKIELAIKEVVQAERMVDHSRGSLAEWENLLDLRRETVAALKLQAKPATRRTKK